MHKISFFENYGREYKKRILGGWDTTRLETNWWYALDFFFSHSFMRGRNDELSNEYYFFTIQALESLWGGNPATDQSARVAFNASLKHCDMSLIRQFKQTHKLGKGNSLTHKFFSDEVSSKNPVIHALMQPQKVKIEWESHSYEKTIHLGNDEDIMMVLESLKFISQRCKAGMNIYVWLKSQLARGEIAAAYERLSTIRAVADKIATFTIRDVLLMNSDLPITDMSMVFPVDTWVKQIAMGLGCESEDIDSVKRFFEEICAKENLSPLLVNSGLWYVGTHSLEILLELLKKNLDVIPAKDAPQPNSLT